MSLWKDMIIDNTLFGGKGDYYFYKMGYMQGQMLVDIIVFMFFAIITIITIGAMVCGWLSQKSLILLIKPEKPFAIFLLNHKMPRLVMGAPVFFGVLWLVDKISLYFATPPL